MPHTIKLTNGAAILLKSIVQAPEAVKGTAKQFVIGLLLESTLDAAPVPQEGEDQLTWSKLDWKEIEVTEKQRDAIKEAITFCADKGILPVGVHLNSLLLQFGLVEL